MFCVRLDSSTKVSAQTASSNSPFKTTFSELRTSTSRVSKALGCSGIGWSSRSSRRRPASRRNGPNSYKPKPLLLIGGPQKSLEFSEDFLKTSRAQREQSLPKITGAGDENGMLSCGNLAWKTAESKGVSRVCLSQRNWKITQSFRSNCRHEAQCDLALPCGTDL